MMPAKGLFLELVRKWPKGEFADDSLHFAGEAALLAGSVDEAEQLVGRFEKEYREQPAGAARGDPAGAASSTRRPPRSRSRSSGPDSDKNRQRADELRRVAIEHLEKVIRRQPASANSDLGAVSPGTHPSRGRRTRPRGRGFGAACRTGRTAGGLFGGHRIARRLGPQRKRAGQAAAGDRRVFQVPGPAAQRGTGGAGACRSRLGQCQAGQEPSRAGRRSLLAQRVPARRRRGRHAPPSRGTRLRRKRMDRRRRNFSERWPSRGLPTRTCVESAFPGWAGPSSSSNPTTNRPPPSSRSSTGFSAHHPQVAEAGYMRGRALQKAGKRVRGRQGVLRRRFGKLAPLSSAHEPGARPPIPLNMPFCRACRPRTCWRN